MDCSPQVGKMESATTVFIYVKSKANDWVAIGIIFIFKAQHLLKRPWDISPIWKLNNLESNFHAQSNNKASYPPPIPIKCTPKKTLKAMKMMLIDKTVEGFIDKSKDRKRLNEKNLLLKVQQCSSKRAESLQTFCSRTLVPATVLCVHQRLLFMHHVFEDLELFVALYVCHWSVFFPRALWTSEKTGSFLF